MSELSVNLDAAKQHHVERIDIGPSTDSLMSLVASGDQAAFEQLIDQHGDSIARLIGRLTAWHADSDDILQEVFLSVWQRAGTYHGQGSVEGWLKRIAINRCRNHFRMASSFKRKLERFVGFGIQDSTQDTHSCFEVNEANEELRQEIGKLGHKDRTILVLYYLEEMPGEEVAQMLNVKLETMHVQLHRARKRLKNLLDKKCDE